MVLFTVVPVDVTIFSTAFGPSKIPQGHLGSTTSGTSAICPLLNRSGVMTILCAADDTPSAVCIRTVFGILYRMSPSAFANSRETQPAGSHPVSYTEGTWTPQGKIGFR